MKRFAMPIVAVAFLTAACGGAATLSSSQDRPVTVAGTVRGANAGSDNSDVNRVNPPVGKPGTVGVRPAATPQTINPASGQPSLGTGADRCGMGTETGIAGNRASTAGSVKRHPLPMCAVQ